MRALGLALLALAAGAGVAQAVPAGPTLAGCPVFPADNAWNRRVDRLPVDPRSSELVAAIGDGTLHADFGSGLWEGRPIGIPVTVVGTNTPRSRVTFEYASESDRVGYPIPQGVRIEGGGDRHAILVDRDACRLYELYALRREQGGWQAGSGAVWSLRSNRLRPKGWTSADAAGLPILPGLARYDEVAAGAINHALRFTVEDTQRGFIFPARHFASSSDDPDLPPMGLRLRLKASYDITRFSGESRVILAALKRFGMIVADNGTSWYLSGAPDARWDNDQLHTLGKAKGSDFRVVDTRGFRSG
jgi:hypothetical protein